jgi:hypothetical protein
LIFQKNCKLNFQRNCKLNFPVPYYFQRRTQAGSVGDNWMAAAPVFGHRSCAWTWQYGLGRGGDRPRGWRQAGRSSRAGGRKELEGGGPEGARGREAGKAQDRWWRAQARGGRSEGARGREAGKARSTAGDLWELDREAFLVSDANGRPAVAREGGRREGNGVRDGGGRPGRADGSSSSSTAGLTLDGEQCDFDFTIQGSQIRRIKMWRGFSQKNICSDSASSKSIRRE